MPQRKSSTVIEDVVQRNRRITLPWSLEAYQAVVADAAAFRAALDEQIAGHPQLFPAAIAGGYTLHDGRASRKMPEIYLRRIKLRQPDEAGQQRVFTIAPSAVLPYLTGYTDEVEKALFLRRFGVPFWGLTYVFGRNDQYWYRLSGHVGRYEIVAPTVQAPRTLPVHLLADEKHARAQRQPFYIALTVGADCVLGAALSWTADSEGLRRAYGRFKREARRLWPAYRPQSVNTDGWRPTQSAWQALFPTITIVLCFLHAYLKIAERLRRARPHFHTMADYVWQAYHAADAATFRERVQALRAWAEAHLTGAAQQAVAKLVANVEAYVVAYAIPGAYRTSNMLDRHMRPLTRWCDSLLAFHGHATSAERHVRAWALLHNFGPYAPRAPARRQYISPAHQLNGFVYHPNWLHNLLISTSRAYGSP